MAMKPWFERELGRVPPHSTLAEVGMTLLRDRNPLALHRAVRRDRNRDLERWAHRRADALDREPFGIVPRSVPDSSPMSILPAVIAWISAGAPPRLVISMSSPCILKIPSCMPTSTDTKPNAEGKALPTRNVSADAAAPNAPSKKVANALTAQILREVNE
jgi:hypothetical protein